jgi:hypothetical protein
MSLLVQGRLTSSIWTTPDREPGGMPRNAVKAMIAIRTLARSGLMANHSGSSACR